MSCRCCCCRGLIKTCVGYLLWFLLVYFYFLIKNVKYFTVVLLSAESWIEVTPAAASTIPKTPDRVTPLPFSSGEEYLRLLREAQKESNQSSRVVSLSSSRRDSPKGR